MLNAENGETIAMWNNHSTRRFFAREDRYVNNAPSGSAGRLIHLLKLIATGPHVFSLSALAERAQLPASTVHRLLKELMQAGFVERGTGQLYRPGRELHRMASQLVAKFDLIRSARPFLDDLVEKWRETAVLCAYSPVNRNAVIADTIATPHPLRFTVEAGREISLPWGALGRAILAFLPAGEIEAVIREAKFGPLSGKPRSPRALIEADLDQIRQQHYSRFYDPENDIAGIASPIFGSNGEVLGCIGVTMPSNRYQRHLEDDLAIATLEAAQHISELAAIAYS
ncbi:IclR family transcriptional regulator [Altericroceibacterium indicum]|nr:IclR family transcriptional regulator [Altericroceibacterium indicum]